MSPAVRPASPSLALLVAPNGACCTSVVVVFADPRSRPSTMPTAAPAPMTAETAAIGRMLRRMEDEDAIPCLMRHEHEVRIPKAAPDRRPRGRGGPDRDPRRPPRA